ncbi:MAG: galactokinase family protein [Anaerolineales bacterium]
MSTDYPDLIRFKQNILQLCNENHFFNSSKTIYINRTPGRLDLLGGNDDYSGGLVFETTIREATLVGVQERTDEQVFLYNPAVKALGWKDLIHFSLGDLRSDTGVKPLESVRQWINQDPQSAWSAYIIGDLYFLLKEFPHKIGHGFNLYLESDVPIGKGVSSSAALEVSAMKAIAHLFGIHTEGVQLASWTQWVEIALTDSACGIMDQLTVTLGDQDKFLPILCQPSQPYPLVQLPQSLRVWGIDSGVKHAISGIEYEVARAATFMGYRYLTNWEQLPLTIEHNGPLQRYTDALWNGYLANLTPSLFRSNYEWRLPEYITGRDFSRYFADHADPYTPLRADILYPVRAATRYAVEENWRVRAFYTLLSSANSITSEVAAQLGELMYLCHEGYSQCGLGTSATDQIIQLVRAEKEHGLIGAKITGGGAGGTVAVLGYNTEEAEAAFNRVVQKYADWSNTQPYIFKGSSPGSDAFGIEEISPAE